MNTKPRYAMVRLLVNESRRKKGQLAKVELSCFANSDIAYIVDKKDYCAGILCGSEYKMIREITPNG